jgi:type VI secretion system secreted protein VgrG
MRPERVVLEDYNWRTPTVAPEGEAAADAVTGYGTQRRYGDHIKDANEGARMAQVRAEELAVTREVYAGRSTLRALAPGDRFELRGYPIGDLDQEYVVTEIEQSSGVDADGYAHRFGAIPYAVPYRPARATPKPRIEGFMHARVDGVTPGMAAPLDEQGRYKVVMPYDAFGTPGGNASRWIRMAQASSGMDYGMHFPLHIGIEIAVMHLGGDPDRPVIAGAIPNPDTASPVTVADATKSRIKTKSGILIEFEDAG